MRGPSATLVPVGTLSIRDAAVVYGVPPSTLARWVRKGHVRKVASAERRGQPTLVLAEDVAVLARQYRPGRGRWAEPSPLRSAS